jgi:cyclophilin family peptidyl-prolyl cis-trans isomerase
MARTDYWQSALAAFDRVEGDDAGDRNDVQQEHDQERPREFHVRLRQIVEVGTGSGGASRGRSQFFLTRKNSSELDHFHLGKA